MSTFETFSKRRKRVENAEKQGVYQYATFPDSFREQVIHIWTSAIGVYDDSLERQPGRITFGPTANDHWRHIHHTLAREIGVATLGEKHRNPFVQCQQYLRTAGPEGVLNMIDLSFQRIDQATRHRNEDYCWEGCGATQTADDAIQELNQRFQEHGIGYQFCGGELRRIDSQYLHVEAVKPAVSLLHDEGFRGASEEFSSAHEHHRKGRQKEAIVEALKAFESTMKTICDARKWECSPNANAKQLIETMFQNGLIPSELVSHFTALRSVLESGLPTVRNKTSGHGQGSIPIHVPDYLAAYALHLTASNIVLLIEAHKATR